MTGFMFGVFVGLGIASFVTVPFARWLGSRGPRFENELLHQRVDAVDVIVEKASRWRRLYYKLSGRTS